MLRTSLQTVWASTGLEMVEEKAVLTRFCPRRFPSSVKVIAVRCIEELAFWDFNISDQANQELA